MEPWRAPALGFCVAFLASVAVARELLHLPVGAAALLVPLGFALGGPPGRAVVAVGCGLLAVGVAPSDPAALFETRHPVAISGRVCSHGLRFGSRAAVEVCADRARVGQQVAVGRWPIRLDLPEGASIPPFGARVRAVGQLGRPPGFENRLRSPPGRWSLRIKSSRFLRIESPPPRPLAWASRGRAALDRGWSRLGECRPGVALARAMVLGDVSALPARWTRALRRTGLVHLTAVSGFNIALVAGWAALAGTLLPGSLRVGLSALAALAYLGLVGPAPSMLRAAAMALVAAAALLSGRAPVALQGLALAGLGLVVSDPDTLGNVGFQLSVAATAGLLIGTGPIERSLGLRPRALTRALAASLAAQAAATPVAVATFGRLTLAAPLLNLFFAPWAALVLVLGLIGGGLSALGFGALAAPCFDALDLATRPLETLAALPPSPWFSASVPPSVLTGLPAGALFLLPALGRHARRAGLLALLALAAAPAAFPFHAEPAPFELAVLDVGQGDSLLLRGEGVAVLVDGGGARGRDLAGQVLLPTLAARGIDRLDLVVLSHFDDDHCRGLAELASYVPFDEIWIPRGAAPTTCSAELTSARDPVVRGVAAGERRILGGLRLEVLNPEPGTPRGQDNRLSLVLRVAAAGRTALLTGDLDGEGERALARRFGPALRCDLLKVAHHGSGGSTTAELLAAARPRLAIVSAGVRNPYGHPAPAVLNRLERSGARVLRTDRDGAVELRWGARGPLRIYLPASPRRSGAAGG